MLSLLQKEFRNVSYNPFCCDYDTRNYYFFKLVIFSHTVHWDILHITKTSLTHRFFCTKMSHLYLQFISTKVRITLLKDVWVEVLPWCSYSKKSAILFNFNSILFKSNILHKLCSLLQFFEMLSCDNALWKAEISWNFWWLKPF